LHLAPGILHLAPGIRHHIHMKTYALVTLGCKVNQYEGDRLKAQLTGLTNVPFGGAADLFIINACSVTAEAEAKARQLVNRAKRTAPDALVVLTGCWPKAQTDNFRSLGVDLFFDNAAKADLVKSLPLRGAIRSPATVNTVVTTRTRAFVKVQDGCDQFCSYCSIPLFRGRLASRPSDAVIGEIAAMVNAGVPEVVLTGIHLGKYGVDIGGGGSDLVGLINAILKATALPRLRISSIEPLEVTDELIGLLAVEARLAKHLHIPLQSGSDKILAAMNRNYSAGEYLSLVKKLRKDLPDIGLTTDIIVGFPGESEADFLATLATIMEAAFSRLHIFKFSARPDTAAASLPGRISPAAKKERAARLKEIGSALSADFAARFIGRHISVVVERSQKGRQNGLTSQYVRAKFERAPDISDNPFDAVGIKTEADVLIARKNNG